MCVCGISSDITYRCVKVNSHTFPYKALKGLTQELTCLLFTVIAYVSPEGAEVWVTALGFVAATTYVSPAGPVVCSMSLGSWYKPPASGGRDGEEGGLGEGRREGWGGGMMSFINY